MTRVERAVPSASQAEMVPGIDIVAVVVAFHPERASLAALLRVLAVETIMVVLVDNGSESDFDDWLLKNGLGAVELMRPTKNVGLAAAQNIGVRRALQGPCEAVVFFDQDSVIEAGLIVRLARAFSDPRVSITAPVTTDWRNGRDYPIVNVLPSGRRKKYFPSTLRGPVDVSVAISSGTLVRRQVFDDVGLFDEGLFIDYVDTEWCLRCIAHGYRIRIDPGVKIQHSIGDDIVRVLGTSMPIHSPLRRYYRVRNSILLLRYRHIPLLMTLREILTGAIHQLLMILRSQSRSDYLRLYLLALRDGVTGRKGPHLGVTGDS
jgi:rhamnosyltransferase